MHQPFGIRQIRLASFRGLVGLGLRQMQLHVWLQFHPNRLPVLRRALHDYFAYPVLAEPSRQMAQFCCTRAKKPALSGVVASARSTMTTTSSLLCSFTARKRRMRGTKNAPSRASPSCRKASTFADSKRAFRIRLADGLHNSKALTTSSASGPCTRA